MTSRSPFVQLDFALKAWNLYKKNGRPLLRDRSDSDIFFIDAFQESDGTWLLIIGDLEDEINELETFRQTATFLGLDPWDLNLALEAKQLRWFNWVPEEEWDDEIDSAHDYIDELRHLLPMPVLEDILRGIPDNFDLSPEDQEQCPDPALPAELGSIILTEGLRPGDNTNAYNASSALALSCLQHHLDRAEKHALIVL